MDFLESTGGKIAAAAVFLILLFSTVSVAQTFSEGSFFDEGSQVSASTDSASMSPAGGSSDSSWFFQGTLISGQEGCDGSSYDTCYLNTNEYGKASVEALIQANNPETLTEKNGTWLVESGESVDYECGEPEPLGDMYHDTYVFHESPSFTWDDDGDGAPEGTAPEASGDYTKLDDNEGSIDIDWTEAKELHIVCVAYQEHWSGDWVWTWQSIYWNDPYKVASDSDNDGIYDYNDQCTETSGSEDTNGCPDSDGDGVKDSEDAFPNDAECQEDSDGDGVCDSKDVAPNDPSIQYDSDQDGIKDSNDDCPETSGIEAKNGCLNQASEIVSLDGSSEVAVGQTVEYTVSVENPDGDSQTISWSNGDTGKSAEYTFENPGSRTVSVTVDDGYDEQSESIAVQVKEAPEPPSPLDALSSFFGNIWSILTFSG